MSKDFHIGGAFQPDANYSPTGNWTGMTLLQPNVTVPVASSQPSTVTLTAAQSGGTFLFDSAAGIVYTLPKPAVGLNYTFVITTTITSNNAKVITDASTTFLIGSVWLSVAAGTGTQFWANGSSHRAVTQNGTTTGGLFGSILYFSCVNSTQWVVDATCEGSGTIATPFATS